MYDYLIVGAGLAGGVLARKLAEEKNKKILILERRDHIAGNLYDYTDEHGILIQKYGPHVFHTRDEHIHQFIRKYCETVPYRTYYETVIDGVNTPTPFNFKTIDQFYRKNEAEQLKDLLHATYSDREEVTIVEMLNSTEARIREFAQFLFEKDYKPYTAKQWNLHPSEIDPSVLKRVPIALSYRDTFFSDKYEFMPEHGFTEFYRSLIAHPNITVKTGVDALKEVEVDDAFKRIRCHAGEKMSVIYTGAIDELFGYRFGVLPYRSLRFQYRSFQKESFQNAAITAFPQKDGYTRVTEYTKMPIQKGLGWTTVAYEYPVAYDKCAVDDVREPYYPVPTKESEERYRQYEDYASMFRNLILCGRLAEFKYYNMDQVILRALDVYESLGRLSENLK